MNTRIFAKGTKIKEYIAATQNTLHTIDILEAISCGSGIYDRIRNALMDNENDISKGIRGSLHNHPKRLNVYYYDYTSTYKFYSGHKLKPGVEYKICFIDNAPLAECILSSYTSYIGLSSYIGESLYNHSYKYLNNIGVFLYRYDPKYSDSMIKEECVIDSYCIFNLYGEYLAPCKPAPRPLEDIEYLETVRKNKHSIKKLDKSGILSKEEKHLLFKNNFYDNIYSDFCTFMRLVKSITGGKTTETHISDIMFSRQTPIIRYPNNMLLDGMISISNLTPEEVLNTSIRWKQLKCPINIPRSLASIATREDEIYHFHAEAPITHKPVIKYKVNPSISYTASKY